MGRRRLGRLSGTAIVNSRHAELHDAALLEVENSEAGGRHRVGTGLDPVLVALSLLDDVTCTAEQDRLQTEGSKGFQGNLSITQQLQPIILSHLMM